MSRPVATRPLPVRQRTLLLHRMLLLRHLTEGLHQPAQDEALAAGVVSALGPGDTLVAAGWPASLLLGGHPGTAGPGQAGVAALHLPPAATGSGPGVLFCPVHHLRSTAPSEATAEVPGSDVEAITCTAAADVAAVRGGAESCLLELEESDDDPVELLAARMRVDHQLDDGALWAMDRAAAARATVLLGAAAPEGPPGRDPRL